MILGEWIRISVISLEWVGGGIDSAGEGQVRGDTSRVGVEKCFNCTGILRRSTPLFPAVSCIFMFILGLVCTGCSACEIASVSPNATED